MEEFLIAVNKSVINSHFYEEQLNFYITRVCDLFPVFLYTSFLVCYAMLNVLLEGFRVAAKCTESIGCTSFGGFSLGLLHQLAQTCLLCVKSSSVICMFVNP